MGQVVVKFVGLCIHVRREEFPALPARHRVILLSNPHQTRIDGKPVKLHVPVMFFPNQEPKIELPCVPADSGRAFQLHGVRLRIANGTNPFSVEESYHRSVPHLTGPNERLEPREDVILYGCPPAAGYFDFDHGRLSACRATLRGAVGTSVVIETGYEDPVLELSCFGVQRIPLTGGPVIEITNVAEHGQDDDNDYLLNYDIVTNAVDPKPPHPDIEGLGFCSLVSSDDLDFGPPCSNSQYP